MKAGEREELCRRVEEQSGKKEIICSVLSIKCCILFASVSHILEEGVEEGQEEEGDNEEKKGEGSHTRGRAVFKTSRRTVAMLGSLS